MPNDNDRRVDRLLRERHALTEIAKTITSPLDLPVLLNAIMNKLIGVLEPAEIGAIMLWDQSSGLFRPAAAFGYDLEILKDVGLQPGEAVTGKVYDQGEAVLLSKPEEVAEAMDDMRLANRSVVARSLGGDKLPHCTLAAPISVDGQKYGVLVLETLNGRDVFREDDLPFVQSLADLIAMAIDRARLMTKTDAAREVRESERLRLEMMATLSHELRIPLTSIKGYTTALLLDGIDWSDEKQAEFLQLIDEECDNIQVMLMDILDSSLLEFDQLALKPQLIRLDRVAGALVNEMKQRNEQHRLVVDFPAHFPLVEVDPHWIKQVFRNILDNAIKYSPDGGLVVIQGKKRLKDIIVNIADQGIGISPENLIPLFEKYFRIKSTSDVRVPGMGMGLPIARCIIEAHGGRIWVDSKKGEGTKVSFSLPYVGREKKSNEAKRTDW